MSSSLSLPFIVTSKSGFCSEGHEFIRICRYRNTAKADLMRAVLVTQYSRWRAHRLHRALFGQSLWMFSEESWTCLSSHSNHSKISNRYKHESHASQRHILSSFTTQFSSAKSIAAPTQVYKGEDSSVCSDPEPTDDSSANDNRLPRTFQHECESDFSRDLCNPPCS